MKLFGGSGGCSFPWAQFPCGPEIKPMELGGRSPPVLSPCMEFNIGSVFLCRFDSFLEFHSVQIAEYSFPILDHHVAPRRLHRCNLYRSLSCCTLVSGVLA